MKKLLLILMVVGIFGLTTSVFGHMWGGYFRGQMMGPYYGYNGPPYQTNYQEILKLKEQLAAKNAEYQALLRAQNPDPKRAAELAAEIERLKGELMNKAQEYVTPYYGCPYAYTHGMCW